MRRPSRLGERFAHAIDTDPIDLRDIRRAAPPRPPAVHQPFAGGRRPDLPSASVRFTVLGAPIPTADVDDPAPRRTAWPVWTPRRRRRARVIGLALAAAVATFVVALAAASVLHHGPGPIG